MYRFVAVSSAVAIAAAVVASPISAQTWSAEQQEIWEFEQQQWKMSAEEELTWVDSMVHPNISYWETGNPMPQNHSSLVRWNRFGAANGSTLEQELLPISIVITGNVAVVNYHYVLVRENYKKEQEEVVGHYMDVLLKENGRWRFIAWSGGDDPRK